MMSEDKAAWQVVASSVQLEIDVLKAALETAGIPCVTLGETLGRIYGFTFDLGEVRLLVPPDRLAEARELLSSATAIDFPEAD